jgi:hypothetical protein
MALVWPKHVILFVRRHGIEGFSARNDETAVKTALYIYNNVLITQKGAVTLSCSARTKYSLQNYPIHVLKVP